MPGPGPWLQLLLRPVAASAAAAKCGMKFKAAIKFGKDNFKCIAWPAAYERPVQSGNSS